MSRKKLSTQEYIFQIIDKNVKCISQYIDNETKILHNCNVCYKNFLASPKQIKANGSGCNECMIKNRSITTEEHIAEIKSSAVICVSEYIYATTKIKYKCKKCEHIFIAAPSHIKRGGGCPKCKITNRRHTQQQYDEIINKSILLRIDPYINSTTKTKHKCKKCDYIFYPLPKKVKEGIGCPECIKHHTAKDTYFGMPATLYYIHILEKNIYKIGITKTTVKRRFSQEKFTINTIQEEQFNNGYDAWCLEQSIIKNNKMYSWKPKESEKFVGWSECFNVDLLEARKIKEKK